MKYTANSATQDSARRSEHVYQHLHEINPSILPAHASEHVTRIRSAHQLTRPGVTQLQ